MVDGDVVGFEGLRAVVEADDDWLRGWVVEASYRVCHVLVERCARLEHGG